MEVNGPANVIMHIERAEREKTSIDVAFVKRMALATISYMKGLKSFHEGNNRLPTTKEYPWVSSLTEPPVKEGIEPRTEELSRVEMKTMVFLAIGVVRVAEGKQNFNEAGIDAGDIEHLKNLLDRVIHYGFD